MTVQTAPRDNNDVPALLGTSSTTGETVTIYADPTTHRLLVDAGGLNILTATGTVNGVNTQFTFVSLPTVIVSDGAMYQQTDNNSVVQWSWNAGTLTATMTIPPTSAIFGIT